MRNGHSGNQTFSICGGKIYNTTSQGAVGAAVVSSLASSRWQHQMFSAGGGSVLPC